MGESKGKWYLVYTYRLEGFFTGLPFTKTRRVPLKATSERVAINEARRRWALIKKELGKQPAWLKTDPKPHVVYRTTL